MIFEDALLRMSNQSRSMLSDAGLTIETDENIAAHEAAMLSIRDRSNHPILSSAYHDFGSDDAFGILVKRDAELVGGMACKRIRLGRDTLASYLVASNRRLYGDGLVTTSDGMAARMSGTIVYQGELFLTEDLRRGKAPVPSLMHLAHGLCALKWHADWHFAFMPVSILNKAPAFGFHHFQLCAQQYDPKVALRTTWECLVCSSHQDMMDRSVVISGDPEILPELTAKSSS